MSTADHTASVEYRDIPGCPGYQAGDDGSIWSCWKNCGPRPKRLTDRRIARLKPGVGTKGHEYVNIHKNKVQTSHLVHRLVMLTFVGPCPEGMEVCHWDGNPANNSLSNLRYDTPAANNADKLRHGTHLFGENHPSASLTDAEVLQIRLRYRKGLNNWDPGNARALAVEYGISKTTVAAIARRAKRRH